MLLRKNRSRSKEYAQRNVTKEADGMSGTIEQWMECTEALGKYHKKHKVIKGTG